MFSIQQISHSPDFFHLVDSTHRIRFRPLLFYSDAVVHTAQCAFHLRKVVQLHFCAVLGQQAAELTRFHSKISEIIYITNMTLFHTLRKALIFGAGYPILAPLAPIGQNPRRPKK